ncbi:hypothetical protein [Turicibacter sanguinis]|uniref:hypothetical protein n=1 Tax=Turicibacter sanguinis TaxID=154288 RepID=UPI0006C37AF0|nr:hypothetical protein [Turicibacter sanguinis]CUN04401.1 Uncharacterised protein [Turicibacter sanguinis]
MKKIIRTSEEYRKQKEKELENRKCPECSGEGEWISHSIFEDIYACGCGCEWIVQNEALIEKVDNQQLKKDCDMIITDVVVKNKRESIFKKVKEKITKAWL